ncbi:MAG: FAD-dependent oxidoreductase [Bacilli bacterium]|nr:FAD-dependent oxidoreductase [Bacilli bacterium]
MYDIIIIGAGIAGLTAAIYASRANKKVLILEKQNYGGRIISAPHVKNYPGFLDISGVDLATNLYVQATSLGAELLFEDALSIQNGINKKVITDKHEYECKSIIIATGLERRSLNIPGEKELIGKGISYCASCDGNFYKDKIVAVVGGGKSAIEDAEYLSNLASKVYLISRKDLEDKIEKNNVEIITNYTVDKINSKDKLESIDIKSSNDTRNIKVDGLFISIGFDSSNEEFDSIIDLDDKGYILADNTHTNLDGIFAAGDCVKKDLRQLVTAASDGAIAATEAIKYIEKNR